VACKNNLTAHHASHPFLTICSHGVVANSVRSPLNVRQLEDPEPQGQQPAAYVDPEVFAVLDRYRAQQHALLDRMPDGWLLSYDGGATSLRAKTLTESISRLADKVGLKGITAHSFRRMTASELMTAGVDAACSC
jgi:hypothetical protein